MDNSRNIRLLDQQKRAFMAARNAKEGVERCEPLIIKAIALDPNSATFFKECKAKVLLSLRQLNKQLREAVATSMTRDEDPEVTSEEFERRLKVWQALREQASMSVEKASSTPFARAQSIIKGPLGWCERVETLMSNMREVECILPYLEACGAVPLLSSRLDIDRMYLCLMLFVKEYEPEAWWGVDVYEYYILSHHKRLSDAFNEMCADADATDSVRDVQTKLTGLGRTSEEDDWFDQAEARVELLANMTVEEYDARRRETTR